MPIAQQVPSLSHVRHLHPLFVVIAVSIVLNVFVWTPSRVLAQEVAPITLEEMHEMLASEEPLVVSLMTSWCGPCKSEIRMLNALYAEFAGQGLDFAGLSLDIAPRQMERMLEAVPAQFPFYWVGEAGMDELEVNAVPQLYLVRDGGIVHTLVGLQEEDELRGLLVELLEQRN